MLLWSRVASLCDIPIQSLALRAAHWGWNRRCSYSTFRKPSSNLFELFCTAPSLELRCKVKCNHAWRRSSPSWLVSLAAQLKDRSQRAFVSRLPCSYSLGCERLCVSLNEFKSQRRPASSQCAKHSPRTQEVSLLRI